MSEPILKKNCWECCGQPGSPTEAHVCLTAQVEEEWTTVYLPLLRKLEKSIGPLLVEEESE